MKATVGYLRMKETLALCILEAKDASSHHIVTVTITIHTALQRMTPSAKTPITGHIQVHIIVLIFHL